MEDWESDTIVEKWLRETDETVMPLPNIDSNPHLLISKVKISNYEFLLSALYFYLFFCNTTGS